VAKAAFQPPEQLAAKLVGKAEWLSLKLFKKEAVPEVVFCYVCHPELAKDLITSD